MNIKEKTTNELKALSAEVVSNAKSGHTGSALGASSIMLSLFHDHLNFDPDAKSFWKSNGAVLSHKDGDSPLGYLNRDRLVLSAGHTSALLYSLLYMFGFDMTSEDLKKFRTCHSKTPGHPEYGIVPSVETTTGPLGQGVANAVGMAIAEAILEDRFNKNGNKIFDYHTYCYAGEGCLMEGVALEACSLAGTLNLNKFVILYDDNGNTIDGTIDLENREDIAAKFSAMGFNVIKVANGNDYDSCSEALEKAKTSDKPVIIIFKTIIGIGTRKEGNCKSHAMPLPAEELAELKQKLGVSLSFEASDDVLKFCRKSTDKCRKIKNDWLKNLARLRSKNVELNALYEEFFENKSASEIDFNKILKELQKSPIIAGREISSFMLNEIAKSVNCLVGGTGDVAPSTLAYINNGGDFSAENRNGKNIHFGIREHAMGSATNGLALSGLLAFDSTFMAFSNYMIPPLKMRAMMGVKVLSIFSHDSLDVGQDGPTHQPIEQIGALRQIVGLDVFRPATEAETAAAFKLFLNGKRPVALIVSKNKLTRIATSTISNAEKGAYVVYEESGKSMVEIFASGKEVIVALEVANKLTKKQIGVRVISVPCEELFARQSESYKQKVLLQSPALKVAIEASDDTVWYKYIGENGLFIGVDNYQTSGDGNEVYKNAGFDADVIFNKILKKLK